MMLTIITPTLNAAGTIRALLDSVSGHRHIIIDGGSTDATRDIVAEYPAVEWIDAPGSSIYEAQNIGIGMVGAGWFYFIGADDTLYSPTCLGDAIAQAGDALVLQGKIKTVTWPLHLPNKQQQAFLYHKSVFDRFGQYDQSHPIYADVHFNRMLRKNGIAPKWVDVILADVAPGGVSMRGNHHG